MKLYFTLVDAFVSWRQMQVISPHSLARVLRTGSSVLDQGRCCLDANSWSSRLNVDEMVGRVCVCAFSMSPIDEMTVGTNVSDSVKLLPHTSCRSCHSMVAPMVRCRTQNCRFWSKQLQIIFPTPFQARLLVNVFHRRKCLCGFLGSRFPPWTLHQSLPRTCDLQTRLHFATHNCVGSSTPKSSTCPCLKL